MATLSKIKSCSVYKIINAIMRAFLFMWPDILSTGSTSCSFQCISRVTLIYPPPPPPKERALTNMTCLEMNTSKSQDTDIKGAVREVRRKSVFACRAYSSQTFVEKFITSSGTD